MLQGLLYCGDCGRKMSVSGTHLRYETGADGTRKRYRRKMPRHRYYCPGATEYPDEDHDRPFRWDGTALDWAVWRHVVDNGIKRPDMIQMQVLAQQEQLREQGDRVDGDIAHARRRLADVDRERDFLIRQAKRGKIMEAEFDKAMDETEENRKYWQSEIGRLTELRDDAAKVQNALEYATGLLHGLQERLPEIDKTPEELKAIPEEERDQILRERRDIVAALCDQVIIWSNAQVKLIGAIDGNEGTQFDSTSLKKALRTAYG